MPIMLAHKLARRLAEVRRMSCCRTCQTARPGDVRYDGDGQPSGWRRCSSPSSTRTGWRPSPDAPWERAVDAEAAGGNIRSSGAAPGVLRQPERPLRDRRPGGRHRPDRPQDHRRHLRRVRQARRRRLLRQGPEPGGPVRSYAARHVAKNIVAAGLADGPSSRRPMRPGSPGRCPCSSRPSAPRRSAAALAGLVRDHFDLRPAALVEALNLRRPIYRQTAAYGHFGRNEAGFTWENTDKAAVLRAEAGQS